MTEKSNNNCSQCIARRRPLGSFKKPYCVNLMSDKFLKTVSKNDICECFRDKKENYNEHDDFV